ncbi:hypothetical protein LSCM4_07611 [Leishmania orientalis]|uniref:Uncharacterized protein n=1 Tax=Leishmania orientalis TaxID=2249476 RepID=A0A836HV62_9TRYP|nr:hypothetical protein LSCM4_07611 [Leishmania orientalis]
MRHTPERVSRAPTCFSLSSACAAGGAPGTSSATSGGSGKGHEPERIDVGSTALLDTEDHQHLLQRPSSLTDIAGLTSSLLLHELSTISSCAGTSRTNARDSAGGSVVVSGVASISSQAVLSAVPEVVRGSIGGLSSCRRSDRQLSSKIPSTVAANSSAATTPTVAVVAGASALSPSCFSKKGQSVSQGGHPFHQPSFFWAGAAPLTLSSTILSESARRFSAPLPLSSSARVVHEDAPDVSATTVVGYTEAEDRPESAEAAAVSIERVRSAGGKERPESADTLVVVPERVEAESATAATPSVTRGGTAGDESGRDADPPHSIVSDAESSAVVETAQNVPKGGDNRSRALAHVPATQSSAFSMRRGVSSPYALAPRCFSAEDGLCREATPPHVGECDSGSSDSRFFSPIAALDVHLARYAASISKESSRVWERSESCEDAPEEKRPDNNRGNGFRGAAQLRDGDVGCITMSSLVTHVAVPPAVQAVLRNADATKEELWMALRTACQQCEVLQRRLARAEGALGSEEKSEMTEDKEGVADAWNTLTNATAHQCWFDDANETSTRALRRHSDEEETKAANRASTVEGAGKAESGTATAQSASAERHGRTARTAHIQANCQCNSGHRMQRHMAGLAAFAPVPVSPASSRNAHSNTRRPAFRHGGSSSSDASSVLRDRVSELIRRVEAERKAQPHAPHAHQSPKRHPRPDSSGLHGPTSSRDADDATLTSNDSPCASSTPSPLRGSHASPRGAPPSNGQPARAPQKPWRMEIGSLSISASACTASSHACNSGGPGSVGETVAPGSDGILAPPTLPAIAGVEAQAPVAQRSYNPTERGRLVHQPPSLRSSKAGGVGCNLGRGAGPQPPLQQQRQLHRRPRSASSASLESDLAMVDESVHSNGPAAAAEGLTALPVTAASTPASWPSNGLQMSGSGCRGTGCLSGSPRADCSHALPSTMQLQSGCAASTCVNAASTAVVAGVATSLSGTLPSLHSSTLSGRPGPLLSPLRSGASISSAESARLRQPQQQHALAKVLVSKAAAFRVADDADQQQTLMSPRSRSPNIAALSPTPAALEMLRQLQQEDAPVPPVTRDDQKAALRQWRREAALMKANGSVPMC